MASCHTPALPRSSLIRRLVLATTAASLLLALGSAPAPAAPATMVADQALDKALNQLVDMPAGPPGVAVIVQRGEQRSFHTAGVANLAKGTRWRASDHMRIASVAKAFSGAAVLGLADRGELSLSDSIRVYLPWLPVAWDGVTVAQALQHTSGLPDYTAAPAFGEFFAKNLHAYIAPRALVEFVSGDPLDFKPGSAYRYSNTDNIIAGLVAAAVSGQSYSAVLREHVFGPLRMPNTTLPTGFRLPRPHVSGYEVSPPEPPQDVTTLLSMSGAWASGGIQSTPDDLNRFIRGYVGRGLFDRETQSLQFHFVKGHSEPPGPGVNGAGLGIFKYTTQCGVVYGHTGNLPGFTQFTAATLDGRRSVTVSVNARIVPEAKSAAVRNAFQALRRIDSLAVCAALAGP